MRGPNERHREPGRRRRAGRFSPWIVAAAVAMAALPSGRAAAAEGAVCTWGGTELAPTGRFEVTPGIGNEPTATPIHFFVTGALEGPSPRCTGTMTLDGWFLPGSRCPTTVGYAIVGGVPGVVSDLNVGVTYYIRGELLGPDGSVVGSYDDSILSNGVAAAEQCDTEEGLTGGTHWGLVTLYPVHE